MERFPIYLQANEKARIEGQARARDQSLNNFLRQELAHLFQGLTLTDRIALARLESRIETLTEQKKQLEDDRDRFNRLADTLPGPKTRALLQPDIEAVEARIHHANQQLEHATQGVETIRQRTTQPRAPPTLAILPLGLLAILPDAGPAAGLTLAGMSVLFITTGGPKNLLRKLFGKEEKRDPATIIVPKESPDAPEEDIYDSDDEFIRKYLQSPDFLRLRIDDFLDFNDSLEAARQFSEDNEFSAINEKGEITKVRALFLTEREVRQIPFTIRQAFLSRRSRTFSPDASLVVEVNQGPAVLPPLGKQNGSHASGNGGSLAPDAATKALSHDEPMPRTAARPRGPGRRKREEAEKAQPLTDLPKDAKEDEEWMPEPENGGAPYDPSDVSLFGGGA